MYIRSVFSRVLDRLLEPRGTIQVLLGPRQAGKTTGARYILGQLEEKHSIRSVFLSADEPELKNSFWLEQQWSLARDNLKGASGPLILVIDEIQKLAGWSEQIKKLWDEDTHHSRDIRLLLLGSSTLLLRQGLSESLAGRFEITHVPHWLYPEMKAAFGFSLDEWVYYGGYPGAARFIKDRDRWSAYIREALIETTVSRDILLVERINKPALLRRLFELGCRNSGQIISFQKMLGQLQDVGNATTLAHYLDLLSHAGLLTGLTKYAGNIIREKASSPKLQVCNTALCHALGNESLDSLKATPDQWGRAIESAVGAHFLNSIAGKNLHLLYWREKDQEVDFILQAGDNCIAFEVKSGAKRTAIPGMKKFSSQFHPQKTWVIGDSYGLSFEEFFSSPIERWLT